MIDKISAPRLRKNGQPDMRFKVSRLWVAAHLLSQSNELMDDIVWKE